MKWWQGMAVGLVWLPACSPQENAPPFPTITVTEKFSYPPRLQRDSIANQAYLDFEEWRKALPEDTTKVGLHVPVSLGLWAVDQCTSLFWREGIEEIELSLIGAGVHQVVIPPRTRTKVLMITGADGLRSALMYELEGFGHTTDSFAKEEGEELQGCRPIQPGELEELILASEGGTPIYLFIHWEESISILDKVMTDLEELGASVFSILYLIQ